MTHRITLNNGYKIPALGLGTWKIKPKKAYDIIRLAIQMGYRHIDCAPIYGNQKEIGLAIHDAIKDQDITRDDLWVTSKLWNAFHEPEAVLPAFQDTLAELQLEYLDLYLIHWPVATHQHVGYQAGQTPEAFISPTSCPLSLTWQAMAALPTDQVRTLGVSNCSSRNIDALLQQGFTVPAINQVEMHPYLPQTQLLTDCEHHQIQITAYAPLGSSDRPAILKTENEPTLLNHPTIRRIAQQQGISVAQVLLAWGLQRQTIVIPKALTPQHLQQNLMALSITLPEKAINAIDNLTIHYRFIKGEHHTIAGSPYTEEYLWGSSRE